MCHTVIAQRMCQVCQRSHGETVIDFTRCARTCSSPFYCLTPKPQLEVCALCAPASLSTPVTSRHGSIDDEDAASTAAAVAAAVASSVSPGRPYYHQSPNFSQAVAVRPPRVGHHAQRGAA